MTTLQQITDRRKKAVQRLFEKKFKAGTRITVGSATCENAAGAESVYATFRELIAGEQDMDVTLDRVGCSGRCDMEPVVLVIRRGEIPAKYVKVDKEKAERIFKSHIKEGQALGECTLRGASAAADVKKVVSLCGTTCPAGKSGKAQEQLRKALKEHGLDKEVLVTSSACSGMCEHGPFAFVYPDNVCYRNMSGDNIDRLISEHIQDGRLLDDLLWEDDKIANRFFPLFGDIGFFGKQLRLTLRNCGVIDPESLDEYLAVRGYEAICAVLDQMSSQDVIKAVEEAGLRGRGGGGFPVATKWQIGAAQEADEKFIICNADEGDPGAFMDRSTIEGDPHTIVEGMMIGAYAVGATKGFVYIRAEYPLAIKRLEKALDDARKAGLLGNNILGSSWDFDIEVRLGAGAFVCGEETALIASIEGNRGMPRPRPPYPSVSGLWGKPTVINNVETLANIPVIILDGSEWFKAIGTEDSRGTKVFALAGDVVNTGLIEVPMGSTIREVVYGVGGGVKGGKKFKAVQTGGPAGGCLPASALDTPIEYATLAKAGSIMGSGGMIVMDETSCMVNVARYFLEFTQDESCGKCTPCREGTKRMLEILTRITTGEGEEGDIEKLERLANTVSQSSLCGLGQAAPNPVLSTIRHFRDEYEAHIKEKRCPAGACKELLSFEIDPEKCVGCTACARVCPVECISGERKKPHSIDQAVCIRCGNCYEACKFEAVLRK